MKPATMYYIDPRVLCFQVNTTVSRELTQQRHLHRIYVQYLSISSRVNDLAEIQKVMNMSVPRHESYFPTPILLSFSLRHVRHWHSSTRCRPRSPSQADNNRFKFAISVCNRRMLSSCACRTTPSRFCVPFSCIA
jgi:hypothetical protein